MILAVNKKEIILLQNCSRNRAANVARRKESSENVLCYQSHATFATVATSVKGHTKVCGLHVGGDTSGG